MQWYALEGRLVKEERKYRMIRNDSKRKDS